MKVLIGSNGGLTGVYLAKRLSARNGVIIYGADSSENNVGKFFVDKQVFIPASNDESFVDRLIELLNREDIDVYLPTHSLEMKVISQNEELIKSKTNTSFMVSPIQTFEALDNKLEANRNLKRIGIPVPDICDNPISYPIFMKRNIGSGSRDSLLVENALIHNAFSVTYKDISFYEYIEGIEYTVDCIFSNKGELLGYNSRVREKTIGGAVSVTSNRSNFDILPWLKIISDEWTFKGCVNFQYIVRDGIPYFIDVNLRYPSGGLALTVESGIDIPNMMIDMLTGCYKYTDNILTCPNRLRMYRHYEELFEKL